MPSVSTHHLNATAPTRLIATMLLWAAVIAFFFLLHANPAQAQSKGKQNSAGVAALQAFLQQKGTWQAQFVQITRPGEVSAAAAEQRGPDSGREQVISGEMALHRPNRLRWQISSPAPQLIVGDGEKIWLYDEELAQVTVRSFSEALGNSPAALIAGKTQINEDFSLVPTTENTNFTANRSALMQVEHFADFSRTAEGKAFIDALPRLDWVELQSKQNDSSFRRLALGFHGKTLTVMRFVDAFSQHSDIIFYQSRSGSKLPENEFRFTPPQGVDIIGAEAMQ